MSSATIPNTELRAREKLYAPKRHDHLIGVLTGVCASLLLAAAILRNERLITPERGAGYALGVLGLSAAVGLLTYSVRKRFAKSGRSGRMSTWFRAHIALGILAPTAILLHSGFQLGSLNSTVALASMLAVAASGFVGRFVYARIHRGLFGRRRDLRELRQEAEDAWRRLPGRAGDQSELARELAKFDGWATDPTLGLVGSSARFATVGWSARRLGRAAQRALPARGEVDEALDDYLWAATRVARFRGYERLFALWHALHVPLCALMFGAAAVHVIAVHLY